MYAKIGDKDKFRIAQEAFQTECRAESMVRAAHSLLGDNAFYETSSLTV